MSDTSEESVCLFCGRSIGDERPLNGEVSYLPSDGDPQFTTFAAHPQCFMDGAHQSFRDEGFFDPQTFLPFPNVDL